MSCLVFIVGVWLFLPAVFTWGLQVAGVLIPLLLIAFVASLFRVEDVEEEEE